MFPFLQRCQTGAFITALKDLTFFLLFSSYVLLPNVYVGHNKQPNFGTENGEKCSTFGKFLRKMRTFMFNHYLLYNKVFTYLSVKE